MITLTSEELAEFDKKLREYRFGEWNVKLGLDQEFKCAYCDKDFLTSFDHYNSWQWDHIIPQSHDGEHNCENIVVCCKACNWLKNNYLPVGDSRTARIEDARRYIQQRRLRFEAEVAEIRGVVRNLQAKATDTGG